MVFGVYARRSPTEIRNGVGTGGLSNIMEIGALYDTSKFFRASCGSELTDIDFDFLPTMEGDRSQKSPVYVNNGPSVNKAKVVKSDSLRILYYNARSLLPKLDDLFVTIETHNFPDIVCIVESWLGHDVRDQELQFQTIISISYVMIEIDMVEAPSFMLRIATSLQCCLVPP